MNTKEHWNQVYTNAAPTQLGWFEADPSQSLQLIERCSIPKPSPIADIGSGASTLISHLLALGYVNLYAFDISEVALEKAKAALGQERAAQVHWIVGDIIHPAAVFPLENVALWHDRAVFHFLTEEKDRQVYRSMLSRLVAPGGFAIIAAFAMDGPPMCSGLPVERYSVERLREFLRDGFSLLESVDYVYQNPSGEPRPYIYTRFQKNLVS